MSSRNDAIRFGDVDETLAAGRRERGILPPRGPLRGRHFAERDPVPFAVVELDQPVVGFDIEIVQRRDRGRGFARARWSGLATTRAIVRRARTRARARPLAPVPTSLSGASMRPCSRPSRFSAVWPCRTNAITARSPTIVSRPVRQNSRRRCGVAEPEAVHRPPRGREAEQLFDDARPATAEAAAPRGVPTRTPATRTIPCAPTSAASTKLANQPIARLSARRRRSRRPRPAVASIVITSTDDRGQQRVGIRLRHRTAGR